MPMISTSSARGPVSARADRKLAEELTAALLRPRA